MGLHAFYKITNRITVSDFQEKLGRSVRSDENAVEAAQFFYADAKGPDTICLVLDHAGEIVGSWSPLNVGYDENPSTIDTYMTPLRHDELISANTSFFDMADIFARKKNYCYFVLDGTEITGFISYNSLFQPICQICILALFFQLEATAEAFLSLNAKTNWEHLSENRRNKSLEVYQRRNPNKKSHPNFTALLNCTMFIDKSTMLIRSNSTFGKTNTYIKELFEDAEKIRNACSHNAAEDQFHSLMPKGKFSTLFHGAQNLIEDMNNHINNYYQ